MLFLLSQVSELSRAREACHRRSRLKRSTARAGDAGGMAPRRRQRGESKHVTTYTGRRQAGRGTRQFRRESRKPKASCRSVPTCRGLEPRGEKRRENPRGSNPKHRVQRCNCQDSTRRSVVLFWLESVEPEL